MTKIEYSEQKPSWSWMAYTGKINYLVQDEKLEWDRKATMDNGRLSARVKRLQEHKVDIEDLIHVIRDVEGCRIGDLWYSMNPILKAYDRLFLQTWEKRRCKPVVSTR